MRKRLSGGYFVINPGQSDEEWIKNTLVGEGAEYFLQTLFQAAAVLPVNFYIGVTKQSYTYENATLALINAEEPACAFGIGDIHSIGELEQDVEPHVHL
jgi:hypothetical protein